MRFMVCMQDVACTAGKARFVRYLRAHSCWNIRLLYVFVVDKIPSDATGHWTNASRCKVYVTEKQTRPPSRQKAAGRSTVRTAAHPTVSVRVSFTKLGQYISNLSTSPVVASHPLLQLRAIFRYKLVPPPQVDGSWTFIATSPGNLAYHIGSGLSNSVLRLCRVWPAYTENTKAKQSKMEVGEGRSLYAYQILRKWNTCT